MEELIQIIKEHIWLFRTIWLCSAFIGVWVFKKTRPSFYKNRPVIWHWVMWAYYLLIGPLALLLSLITLINPDKDATYHTRKSI